MHHWDQWLTHFLGENLLDAERQLLAKILSHSYGKHTLLIGVPRQYSLLKASVMPYSWLITPLPSKTKQSNYIESNFDELPLQSGSVDLVVLPHTLEYVDNPRQVLAEACRVVKPEGCILICGFNPYSLWGLKKLFSQKKKTPWSNNFTPATTIKKWLKLADFEIINQQTTLFRPPFVNSEWYEKLRFLEQLSKVGCSAFGSVYMITAKAKVIPLTPIRLRWKQQLSGIRISTTITGRIIRSSK
ncbi:MAG: hypothetical protein A3E84_01515 [Gammaproteobacteria bacterium RIFCSPHIGHO2_12_FULL_42_13]|nr:MAG: hypothetical protein A3E84_01515 [Gammaproteobacteria bacterium RIFCSPHIGHO2_12_FULL_42_13]